MKTPQTFAFDVFADYNQFYVQDGGICPDAPTDWTDVDVERRAKAAANLLVICPVRNMTVPVSLDFFEAEPEISFARYDHAIQASVDLPSGKLQVHECSGGDVFSMAVPPGTYAVLILFAGPNSISDDGLDGEDPCRLILWSSAAPMPLSVLKAWAE